MVALYRRRSSLIRKTPRSSSCTAGILRNQDSLWSGRLWLNAGTSGDMRHHNHLLQLGDEVGAVIAAVSCQCQTPVRSRRMAVGHVDCGTAFDMPIRLSQVGLHDRAGTVLHLAMPHKAQLGACAGRLLERLGLGGAFERRTPRKSTSALRLRRVGQFMGSGSVVGWSGGNSGATPSSGGSPCPSGTSLSLGWKLFIDSYAFTMVASTEKRSSDSSGATSRCSRMAALILWGMSVVSSRSEFFVKTDGTQTVSSISRPTNQRNSRLKSICSII